MKFTDSLNDNMELLKEILGGMAPGQKERAKRIAMKVEQLVLAIQRDNPTDPAAGIGLAFAMFYISQRMVEGQQEVEGDAPRIQLLS